MKHLTTHTAPPCCFCLFYLQQLADVFYIKSPEPNCQRDSSVFLKALAFITCNRAGKSAHGKIPSWSTRSRQRSSTWCILQGHPVERQKFGRLEIWVAEPRNCWEKADKDEACARVWKHLSTNAGIYIQLSAQQALFQIMGKNNHSSLLSFSSTAEQELKYQLPIQILNKLLQLWTHKTCRVLCHENQKCSSQF